MSIKEKLYQFIKSLIAKYGSAFPSFRTLAKVAGCSERDAVDHIKQLIEDGRIRKETRYAEVDGQVRQLSNGYEVVEIETASPLKAFKKSFKKAFKNLEDEYINAPAPYFPFEKEIQKQHIPSSLRAAILKHMAAEDEDIWRYAPEAIQRALKKAVTRMMNGLIYHPAKWIVSTLKSEQVCLELRETAQYQAPAVS